MSIGQFNVRITIKPFASAVQDEGGGLTASDDDSYSMWAQVEDDRSGFPFTGEEQQIWNYDYRFRVRYEKTRIIKSNYFVEFDNKTLKINSVSFKEEGKRRYSILRCSTTDNNV